MVALSHEDRSYASPLLDQESALLAAIVRSAADAIIGVDLNGIILSWNAAATALYGHSAQDMCGRHLSRIIPEQHRRDHEDMLDQVCAGARMTDIATFHTLSDGRILGVSATITPVPDRDGEIVAAALFIRPRRDERASGPARETPLMSFSGPSRDILVVEDEPLAGLGLAAMLENAGFDVLGPVTTLTDAMALLETRTCSLAILDIHLGHGETSAPIARHLKARDIPFLVTSGYLDEENPPVFADAPSFSKPVRSRTLVAAVQALLG